jgi:hypothetical protein
MAKQNAFFIFLIVLVLCGLYREFRAMPSQNVDVNAQGQGVSAISGKPCSNDDSEKFKMASDESHGFFYDVPESDWETQRSITKMRINNKNAANPLAGARNSPAWYQENWEPDFSCRMEQRIGGMGDGGKWMCDPFRLPVIAKMREEKLGKGHGCLIYSVGSQGNFMFEDGVRDLLGVETCEIHTFDPGSFGAKVAERENMFYHNIGLGPSYGPDSENLEENFKTIQQIKKDLGHEGRTIDIFKIDCEGCEWKTYKDWADPEVAIRQLLVEVHEVPPEAQDFFTHLQNAGFVIFHKEPNIQYGGGRCNEYGLLKLDKEFATKDSLAAVETPAAVEN